MTTYHIRRTRAYDDYDYDPTAGTTIEVWDHEPSYTGLLDQNGDQIWRDPRPIGFHHPEDGG